MLFAEVHLDNVPSAQAALTALRSFQKDFESDGANLGIELLGFESRTVDKTREVSVFNIPAPKKLQTSEYDCPLLKTAQKAKLKDFCEVSEETDAVAYLAAEDFYKLKPALRAKAFFTVEEFEVATLAAIGEYKKLPIGDLSLIQNTKAWRSYSLRTQEKVLFVRFERFDKEDKRISNTYLCHYHKHHHKQAEAAKKQAKKLSIDCHRARPDRFEPESVKD